MNILLVEKEKKIVWIFSQFKKKGKLNEHFNTGEMDFSELKSIKWSKSSPKLFSLKTTLSV